MSESACSGPATLPGQGSPCRGGEAHAHRITGAIPEGKEAGSESFEEVPDPMPTKLTRRASV